jgi:hypothetical protein
MIVEKYCLRNGKTKHGKYISEPDALKEGDHAAKD